jgi:hypothetical protein
MHLASTISKLSYARSFHSNNGCTKKRAAFKDEKDANLTLKLLSITKESYIEVQPDSAFIKDLNNSRRSHSSNRMSTEGSDNDHF